MVRRAGGPPFGFLEISTTEGAPPLRTLQGWVPLASTPTHAFGGIVPALAKSARTGHPPCWRFAQDQKPEPPAPNMGFWERKYHFAAIFKVGSALFAKLAKIENK